MKTVGLSGGSALFALGSAADVQLFFDCIHTYVASKCMDRDWSLLTDRLYRRYLRCEELEPATALVAQVKKAFVALPSTAVDWSTLNSGVIKTRLDPNRKTLAEVFEEFFESYKHCVESAQINYEGFKTFPGYEYEPVRLVISDQPWFLVEKRRPLEEYDSLEGPPFWACS